MGFLGLLREQAATTAKPMTIILDNATIHHAKGIAHVVRMLQKQGITLYFLPAYSPELNRIETLWRLIKYSWMEVKQRSTEILEADVSDCIRSTTSANQLAFRHPTPTQRREPSLIADAEIKLDSTRAFQGCVQSGISMANLNADGQAAQQTIRSTTRLPVPPPIHPCIRSIASLSPTQSLRRRPDCRHQLPHLHPQRFGLTREPPGLYRMLGRVLTHRLQLRANLTQRPFQLRHPAGQ